MFGLHLVAENLEDDSRNMTEFVLIKAMHMISKTVIVAGLGLIGGSMAKAIKKQQAAEQRDPHRSKPNHTPADDDIIEVDLHINALLDNTAGLSPAVLLNTQLTEFRIIMDRNIRRKGQRIVFIHGKGEVWLRSHDGHNPLKRCPTH